MTTKLDEAVFSLMDAHPEWQGLLAPEDVSMLIRRRQGATLKEIAGELGLTPGGVRLRLYGAGIGKKRHGGLYGRLRGLALREMHQSRGA
jgi:predicted transcriptional regulator